MATNDPIGQVLEGTFAKPDRVMHYFQLPESLAKLCGVKKLGLVELTAEEELQATRRCGTDAIRLAFELAKESLRSVDGKTVGSADGSSDVAYAKLHPKARTLVTRAFAEIHNPSMDDTVAFLASRQTMA